MPKVTRPPKKQAEEAVSSIKVDGETYTVRFKEISGLDANAVRRATGGTVQKMLGAGATDDGFDLDVVATIVFLARRQRGEKNVKFETVAASITYGSEIETDVIDEPEVVDPQT